MKGVVFTEFLEVVEAKFSVDLADQILDGSELDSGGVYTAVGTYHHGEMVTLVAALSERTDIAIPDLLRAFGEYLFSTFETKYPGFFESSRGALDFLSRVDDYIHVEVRKLYPDAELPSFDCQMPQTGCLHMIYESKRPFAPLAEGLINGCIAHFGQPIDVTIEDLSNGAGTKARFILTEAA